MAYEQRDNSGSVFVNDRKEKPNHPDRTGKAMIGGVMYYVNGWLKESNGKKFLSLSFKPIDGAQATPPAAQAQTNYTPTFPSDSNEVPF